MKKCSFGPSAPAFLSGLLDLDYTHRLTINVETRAEAEEAFRLVLATPESDIFWGRFEVNGRDFTVISPTSFVISDADRNYTVTDFRYDRENQCTAYSFHLDTVEMAAKGEALTTDFVELLSVDDEGRFGDLFGAFNCHLSAEDPDNKWNCKEFSGMFSNIDANLLECLMANYDTGGEGC